MDVSLPPVLENAFSPSPTGSPRMDSTRLKERLRGTLQVTDRKQDLKVELTWVMSSENFTRTSLYLVRLKIFQWIKFLRRHLHQIQRNWAGRNRVWIHGSLLGCLCGPVIRFSVVGVEKRSSGGGKTRGSGTEKRCSHQWFHMIFSCTDPDKDYKDTFCTSSLLPLKNPQGVANLKKAICVVRKRFDHRSHSIIFLLFVFKSVMLALGNSEKCSRCIPNRHAVRGRFTPKDDCERQVWNAGAASWTQRENYRSM